MPTKILPLLLFCFIGMGLMSVSFAADSGKSDGRIKIITPKKQVKKAKSAAIDDEKFEAGLFFGAIAIEDFSVKPLIGASFLYHINDQFFAQINYGLADAGRATFEDVIGGDFLSEEDEDYSYFSVNGGYNLFPSRSFLGKRLKFNSRIYLVAGLGSTTFAGDSNLTFNIGASYRIVLTDWLTWNIDFIDHIHERDFLADEKYTQNIEFRMGFNALF